MKHIAPIFSKIGGYGGCIELDCINGEWEITAFMPARKKYVLEVGGNIKSDSKAETYIECDTHQERIAWMWAFTICNHPTHAWFNDPADPGLNSNKRFTQDGWEKLPEQIKEMARKFASEDNRICAADGIRRKKPWINGGV